MLLYNNELEDYMHLSLKNKLLDKISITVRDQQTSSLPLVYQTEFYDYSLVIGDNILSQHWREKNLTANSFSDKNTFRYFCFTYLRNFNDLVLVCLIFILKSWDSYKFYCTNSLQKLKMELMNNPLIVYCIY